MTEMTIEQTKKFLDFRKKGYDPRSARMAAKSTIRQPKFEWTEGPHPALGTARHREQTNEGLVDVHLSMIYDRDPDLSWIGEYSSEWRPGAQNWHNFAGVPQWSRRNTCQWFIPSYSFEERLQDHRHMSKGPAHEAALRGVREDMRLMQRIDAGDVSVVGVRALAFIDNVELGEDSTWGILFDWDVTEKWSQITDPAEEVTASAVGQAIDNLCPHCRGSGRKKDDG